MNLVEFGRIISHESRVSMLLALMGGKALPAGELAYRAGVSNQTTSSHLRELEECGMVRMRKCGRFRYFELASDEIAAMLEKLAVDLPKNIRAAPDYSPVAPSLKRARFCYDHLAGELGVAISSRLLDIGALQLGDDAFEISPAEHPIFEALGVDLDLVRKKKRKLSPRCLDWSERVPHVAGALGCAIAERFVELGYVSRSRDDRTAIISDKGTAFFQETFGIDFGAAQKTLSSSKAAGFADRPRK